MSLAEGNRHGSQEVLLQTEERTRGSNGRALKIAGITALVCLLVCAQVFTAYTVYKQSLQVHELKVTNQRMENHLSAPFREAPQKVVIPYPNRPMINFFADEMTPEPPKAETPKQDVADPTVEEQLRELIEDHELPQMNESFLDNLHNLKQQLTEDDWKGFESWLRHWMIFQMAQKTPTPESEKADFVR